jgi:excisionase family DNA binding protein
MLKEKSLENLEFYSPKEIADILRVNTRTVLRYIEEGKITALKMKKNLRIEKKNFMEFLENMKSNQNPQ